MDRSDVISLISVTRVQDDYGDWTETLQKRQVYCQVNSIQQREFFEAGRNGLNPQYRFTIFFGDYQDEELVEFNGKTYSIYRTYLKKNDQLELYVERKGGSNGIESTNQAGTT